MTQRLFSKAGLLVLALLTLLLTVAINQVFKGARLDLTEDRLFTLSEGTHKLLGSLESDATLQLFYSESQTHDIPTLRNYSRRVTELLEEYVAASKGKLKLEVIDPEPFSENEDKAAEYGLQAIPLGNGSQEIYFGLVIRDNSDSTRREIIGFIHPDKERFLEYELSKMIYSVTQKTKPKVGIITGLQVRGGFDMATRQPTDPWTSISQLETLYNVTTLKASDNEVPKDLKLLIIAQPKGLSEQMSYSIDQFVLAGGNALVFIDPNAESDSPNEMMGMGGGGKVSSLDPLFKAWGIAVDTSKVVADAKNALSVGSPTSGRPVRHLGIFGLDENNFNKNDVVTSSLKSLNFATAGAIQKLDDAETSIDTLIHSSDNSMLMDASAFSMMTDPTSLYKNFKSTGESYILAARITGHVKTAYPSGKPKKESSSEEDKDKESKDKAGGSEENAKAKASNATNTDDKEKDKEKSSDTHLASSVNSISVIVVTDTDILTDRLWVRKSSFFGQNITQAFANNGEMLTNMVDNLLGDANLISIRSLGQFSRPFTIVNELESEAEANFHKKENELKQELQETESKLRELQSKKEGEEALVVSAEQEQEVEKFIQEKLKIRKDLREVQHQLGKDIADLGSKLKLINILAVPLLITLLVLGFRFTRRRKR
ncbi:MAG: Gldg family protein [Candidatus Endonucleobacter bathymodioli]|uniref:Gldg family protein n=1 Tax=Candidatus Endonucleibacter bathymodioli TaxID=539814 RepID=A0AA90NJZ7_9GAMM|nr:Gldg family protein [Candidatus Endonucleobacter bathymodioli]